MSIDEESEIKKEMFVMEKTGMHRFYCEICEVACSSQLTLNGHYAGKKHQRVLRKNVVTGKEISKQSLLQEKTNKKDESVAQKNFLDIAQTEPVIGLEYIVEYRKMNSKVVPKYQCELCCIQCDTLTIYSHVCSNKHRLKYLKQHHFQRYKEITGCPNYFKQTSSVLSKKTFFHSKAVMNIYGGPEMLGNVQVRENATGAVGQQPCIMVVPFKMPTVLNCFEEQLSQKEKDLLEKEKQLEIREKMLQIHSDEQGRIVPQFKGSEQFRPQPNTFRTSFTQEYQGSSVQYEQWSQDGNFHEHHHMNPHFVKTCGQLPHNGPIRKEESQDRLITEYLLEEALHDPHLDTHLIYEMTKQERQQLYLLMVERRKYIDSGRLHHNSKHYGGVHDSKTDKMQKLLFQVRNEIRELITAARSRSLDQRPGTSRGSNWSSKRFRNADLDRKTSGEQHHSRDEECSNSGGEYSTRLDRSRQHSPPNKRYKSESVGDALEKIKNALQNQPAVQAALAVWASDNNTL